jgi:hypothetical protein
VKQMDTIDPQTGEVQDAKALTIFSPDTFVNIAVKPVSDEQATILLDKIDPDDLDVLPTGEVYLTQAKYRARLNKAFRPGGWAMRPLGSPYIKDELAMQEWALYANGQFLAYAVGGAEYKASNQRMNWSDVLETLKSNALMRLCKDLGIAAECWNKQFTESFKAQYCFKVWVEDQKRPQWRRMDSNPLYKERGIVEDSPNKEKYVKGQTKKQEQVETPITERKPAQAGQAAVIEHPTKNGGKVATDAMTNFWQTVKAQGLDKPEGQKILAQAGGDASRAVDILLGMAQEAA